MVGTVSLTPARDALRHEAMITPTRTAVGALPLRSSVTPVRNATPRAATPSKDRPPRSRQHTTSVTRSLTAHDDRFAGHAAGLPEYPAVEPVAEGRQRHVGLVAQVPVGDAVRCLAAGHDGQKVWTGDRSGAVKIRNTQTGELIAPAHALDPNAVALEKPGILPNCMAYTASCGGQVWVGFSDGFVRVFAYDTDLLMAELLNHNGPVLAIVADGATIYTGGQDWKVTQWSAQKLKQVTTYTGHKNAVRSLAMTYECLVSGGDDCTIRMWNASRRSFRGHTSSVLALTAVGAGELWSAAEDGAIAVWDLLSGAMLKKLMSHTAPVTCLTLMEGGCLWSADKHGVVVVWDTADQEMVQRMSPDSSDWQRNGITAASAVQRCVSWRVWTCSGDGNVRIWTTPASDESEERQLLDQRLRLVEAHKDTQATQLESLLAAQDTSALRMEIEAVRKQLAEQQELLVKGDFRVVEMASETDALRYEAERYKAFELESHQERQRRMEAEAISSRAEARLLVLQQECQARAAALQSAEEDRQKHRQHLEKMIELERELELESHKKLMAEGRTADLEKSNEELRMAVKELRDALSEASYSSQQQADLMHTQRTHAQRSADESLTVARIILSNAELDSRAVVSDLEMYGRLEMERSLAVLQDVIAAQALATPPAAHPVPEAWDMPDATTLLHTNEMLGLRVQSLEAALADTQRRSVTQSCEEQTNIARVQHLESLVEAHKAELSDTAAELAHVKCDLESVSAELVAQTESNARLQEAAASKDKELLSSSNQLQRFKHQLEQNIMCITHLEGRLKGTQDEKLHLQRSHTELEQELVSTRACELSLDETLALREEAFRQKNVHLAEAQMELETLRATHDVLKVEAGTCSDWVAKYEQAVQTHKEEKRLLVRQLGELEVELRRVRDDLAARDGELAAVREQMLAPVAAPGESQMSVAEREQLRASLMDMTGTLCERDAQLEIMQSQMLAKTEQLNKQTETLGDVVAELTERRRSTNELAARLEDLEIQKRSGDVLQQRQKEAMLAAEDELHTQARKWAAERAAMQGALDEVQEDLSVRNSASESTRLQLDTTLRELALLREDSQCEIRMLQAQLASKNEEINRAIGVHRFNLSPSASPTPFVMQEDDVAPQHTPVHYTESYPSFHSRSLSPRPAHAGRSGE